MYATYIVTPCSSLLIWKLGWARDCEKQTERAPPPNKENTEKGETNEEVEDEKQKEENREKQR